MEDKNMKKQSQKIQFDFDAVNQWIKLPYTQNLIEKYKPACIFIGGSHLTPFVNEESDCDIIIATQLPNATHRIVGYYTEYFEINGVKLHWYCESLDGWKVAGSVGYAAGRCKFYGLQSQHIVYVDPGYQDLVDFYLSQKKRIALVGLYRTVLENDKWWQPWLFNGGGKIPYKGLYCVFWVARELGLLSVEDQLIWKIKNKHGMVGEEISAQCRELFCQLRQKLQQKSVSITQINLELLQQFENIMAKHE